MVACSSGKTGEQYSTSIGNISAYKMSIEHLPALNTARTSHRAMLLNDELTVFGGHTEGFVPTPTAEHFRDGAWHTMQMTYTHDGAMAAILEDGTVMLGGGCSESFGIGQSWGVERYDPFSHSFIPLCIMDRKRAFSSAALLPDGQVLVSGNWYADDDIEVWTPGKGFTHLKSAAEPRTGPFIFRSGPDNAIIFSGVGNRGQKLDGIVDRMNGEPFRDSVLDKWAPLSQQASSSYSNDAIGEYAYLLLACSREDGHPGILKVSGESFSELETEFPLPTEGLMGAKLQYANRLLVDRPARQAYAPAMDSTGVFYAVRIDYDPTFEGGKAPVTLFYADISEEKTIPDPNLVLMPGGRIALLGGTIAEGGNFLAGNNFAPVATAMILHTGELAEVTRGRVLMILLIGMLVAVALFFILRKKPEEVTQAQASPALMARIIALMENEKIFTKKGLTKTDVAVALGTNVTYVSAAINTQHGCTFPEFVADYRVRYAQKLMLERKGVRLSDIGDEAGFANEQTFFRTFKARTGLTPQEWKNHQGIT